MCLPIPLMGLIHTLPIMNTTLLILLQIDMLRCIHSVITSSVPVPTHSVSFPLDRSDKDNVAVMVSTIHKFGNSPVSAVIWLYLDGCISSAYNSANKGTRQVNKIFEIVC